MFNRFRNTTRLHVLALVVCLSISSLGLSGCSLDMTYWTDIRAALLSINGNNREAEEIMDELLQNAPDGMYRWHVQRGDYRLRQNKNLDAIKDYEKALEILRHESPKGVNSDSLKIEYEIVYLDKGAAHDAACGIMEAVSRAVYQAQNTEDENTAQFKPLSEKMVSALSVSGQVDVGPCSPVSETSKEAAAAIYKQMEEVIKKKQE